MRNIAIAVAVVSTTACATTGANSGVTGGIIGGLTGAAACAISGANTAECAALVVGGALAGFAVASYIAKDDAEAYQAATKSVLDGEQEFATQVSEKTGTEINVSRVTTDAAFVNDQDEECTRTDVEYKGEMHQDVWCKGTDGKWTLQAA